jgi:hypothetical protein
MDPVRDHTCSSGRNDSRHGRRPVAFVGGRVIGFVPRVASLAPLLGGEDVLAIAGKLLRALETNLVLYAVCLNDFMGSREGVQAAWQLPLSHAFRRYRGRGRVGGDPEPPVLRALRGAPSDHQPLGGAPQRRGDAPLCEPLPKRAPNPAQARSLRRLQRKELNRRRLRTPPRSRRTASSPRPDSDRASPGRADFPARLPPAHIRESALGEGNESQVGAGDRRLDVGEDAGRLRPLHAHRKRRQGSPNHPNRKGIPGANERT